MPLAQFICPDKERITISQCLSGNCRMSNRCAPLSYLSECARQRQWTGKPSVTQLLNGTRMAYLMLTTNYAEDPQKCLWKILGTSVHKRLDVDDKFSFSEVQLDDEDKTGILDRVEEQANKELWLVDKKFVGSFKASRVLGLEKHERIRLDDNDRPILNRYKKPSKDIWFTVNPDKIDMDDWAMQLNTYRKMFEESTGFEISRLMNFIMIRDGDLLTAKQRGVVANFYYIEVPFIDNSKVSEYMDHKRNLLLSHMMTTDRIPEPCSLSEVWGGNRCEKYCPVVSTCVKHGNPYITQLQSEEE